jgi:hypothetical protein
LGRFPVIFAPFYAKAKMMLREHGITYDEISVGRDTTLCTVRAIAGCDTVPQGGHRWPAQLCINDIEYKGTGRLWVQIGK